MKSFDAKNHKIRQCECEWAVCTLARLASTENNKTNFYDIIHLKALFTLFVHQFLDFWANANQRALFLCVCACALAYSPARPCTQTYQNWSSTSTYITAQRSTYINRLHRNLLLDLHSVCCCFLFFCWLETRASAGRKFTVSKASEKRTNAKTTTT